MPVLQQILNSLMPRATRQRWSWLLYTVFLALIPAMPILAAPATQEFQAGVGGPTGNGHSIANQSVTLRRNADNPTGTTFTVATNPLMVTLSLSNFQHTVPTSYISTGRALNFGDAGVPIYGTLNGIGSPSDNMFSSLPITLGQGISVTQNGAVAIDVDSRPLATAGSPTTGRYYYGDLTISFSRPLTNPTLHFSAMGGALGALGIATEFDLDVATSPGVTLSKLSGNTVFSVNASQILNTASSPSASCATNVAACGSVLAAGNAISSIKLKVYLRGNGGLSNWSATSSGSTTYAGDLWYFAGVSVQDEYDYGDAPVGYGAPSHAVVAGIRLGTVAPDSEASPQHSANADGDDLNSTDDEDGVTLPTLIQGQNATIAVNVTQASANSGYLQGWIDWNGDGDFADSGEQVATNLQYGAGTTGIINIPVTVPANATSNKTYARFRWSTTTGLNSTVLASDGELEDYALTIAAPVMVNCPTEAAGSGSGYATSGTGLYKNDIFWLDWSCGAVTQFNPGDTVNKSWTLSNGLQINAQISNITAAIAPYNSGDWGGDTLDNLYSGVNPIGLVNVTDSQDPTYTVSFSASLNGVSIPADIVTAEAEDSGHVNESATWITDGSAWQPIEAFGALSAQFTNAGKTLFMNNDPDAGGGTLLAFSRDVSSIAVDMKAGGKEALAFGVFSSFDYGDIKAGYPASQGHYMRKLASGGSTPSTLTPVSSLTMATLSNSTAFYLGATQPDAETADQNSVAADADGAEEDGVSIPALVQGQTASITATVAGAGGYLQGWIDWNGDSDFADAGEQVATNIQDNLVGDTNNTAGTIAFNVSVPAGAVTTPTYARFRWSSTSGLSSTAVARDGEIEDYALTVAALDYGDAPSNMSSIDASLGTAYGDAWHSITGNVRLGNGIDGESASQSTGLLADGDGADDDGVIFPQLSGQAILRVGQANSVSVTASSAGFLNAWIDWNQDGDWNDVGEQIASNQAVVAGANTLSVTPTTGSPHGATYARFRLTSAPPASPSPLGVAADGEVEDYRVSLVMPKPVGTCAAGIQNGGFENPTVTANTFIINPEEAVPYWGTIPLDPASGANFAARNGIEFWATGFSGVPSHSGINHAELNANVPGLLYQDLETDPGTVLSWSFAHRGRSGSDTLRLMVGSPGATVSQGSFTTGNGGWQVYSGTYTVPAGQTITRFGFESVSAAGGSQSYGNFVDSIYFGAYCADHGDAPVSYGTPSHTIAGSLKLGATAPDSEAAAQHSTAADGDGADEDGITLPTFAQGQTATLTATVSGTGYLQGWIDFNGNGVFDAVEKIAVDLTDGGVTDTDGAANGTISWLVNVPVDAVTTPTYARFRWATTTGLDATTAASDGEVEDYAVTILAKGTLSGTVFRDDDQSNLQNGAEPGIGLISVSLYRDNGTPTNVTDDTLVITLETLANGTYTFANLDPGSYRVTVDTADPELPAGALIGTSHPRTGVTVTAGNTTTVDFGFDIFTCMPGGGGTSDAAISPFISKEVSGTGLASRNEADTLDDTWRSAAGLPTTGKLVPWLGTTARSLAASEPALFSTYGVAVDVTRVNIQPASPCLGSEHTSGASLSTAATMQDLSPRPTSLYNTVTQPAFWTDTGGDNQSPNAVRFTFANPVKSFGAWFGDLETRTDGYSRPAWLRLLDSSGNRIGGDIPVTPTDLSNGTSTAAVNQNLCGSTAPGTDTACGNQSSRWVGFVDSAASARIKHVVVIVGDDDFGDDAGTEQLSFIGMDIVQEDFGDAPASYGDASHWLAMTPKAYLGTTAPDKENQSQNTANGGADGTGDDSAGSDDEDGIANFPILANGAQDYSLNVTVNNTSGSTARLVGWIDFNRNGVFDTSEAATVNVATGASNKIVALTWGNLPADTTPGNSYLRLRLTTDSSIATGTASTSLPTGTAQDGEVEDYTITIGNSGFTLSGKVYHDTNVNGTNDAAEKGIKDVTMVLQDIAAGSCRSTKTGADGSYHFDSVQPAAADNYVLYEAAKENHQAPTACPPVTNDPNGYVSTTANTLTVTVTAADVTDQNFGDAKLPTFTLEHSQVILPYTTVAYPHIFQAKTDGSVSFSVAETAKPTGLEWGVSVLLDNNCDAQLDNADTVITGSINVTAGDKLCLLAKVLAPANATSGASHTLDITSSFVFGDGSSGLAVVEQTRTDITKTSSGTASEPVGGEGKLSLQKSVWNTTRNIDGSVALPGETLRYTIAYENIGNGELDELVVNDTVPAFTQLGGAGQGCGTTPPELTACNPAQNGTALDWSFTGKLKAGSSGEVFYEVIVE